MKTLNISQNTHEPTTTIDISANPDYLVEEKKFLGWCQKRISIFLETHDIPDDMIQQILLQIPNKIKKSISSITIGADLPVIEKYKIEFFLDSSFESEIIRQTEYFIWKKNMEKYIHTPASLTSRILKVLAYNKVENINNLSVEDFLLRFESFPDKVKESLFEEKTRLEKHSQRVNQAQDYLNNMQFSYFSEEKIRQDGWFTGFYESVDFPEIEQRSTIDDIDYQKTVTERKHKEPQPVFINQLLNEKPTKKVEKATKFTVASLLFAGALVTWSIYNLQSRDNNKSQENLPSAMKFNESWFQRAFQDMIYSQMQKWKEWSEIEDNVSQLLWQVSLSYWIDPSEYNFVLSKQAETVDLELQQKWKTVYFFRYSIPRNLSMYIQSVDREKYAENFKQFISEKADEYRNNHRDEFFRDTLSTYLAEQINNYMQNNLDENKHFNLQTTMTPRHDSIEIYMKFKNQDDVITYQTELIIHY